MSTRKQDGRLAFTVRALDSPPPDAAAAVSEYAAGLATRIDEQARVKRSLAD
ncbi:hypothetical protein ABZ471_48415 [Streptomyces sp. NPDC005728]|uniref:hypothetical protein n=1 Tax=Streptomyces sp. NPDC005728 TaxID=3157054 RepID=UPI00340D3634